ncbi:MAG: Rrf2 family transcriptional regulator [Longimicrobiales bacterium]
MLSQTAEYALRAVLFIARAERELGADALPGVIWLRVEDVAAGTGVPRNYLSKTLHALRAGGVLDSTRGPNGGFRLAVPEDRLTVARVVEGFDPAHLRSGCLLGPGPCNEDDPCTAHHRWRGVERAVRTFFSETTVADLLGERPAPSLVAQTEERP